jgi:hypothetical protein
MGLLRFNISVPAFGAGTTWSEDDNSTIPDTTCDVPLDSYTPGMIGKGIGYTNPSPTARLTMRYYGSSIWFWGRTIDISDMKIAAGGVLNWTMELNDDYPVAGPGLPTPAVDPLLVYWQQDAVGLRFADIGPGSDFPKGGSWQLDGVTVTTEIQTEA